MRRLATSASCRILGPFRRLPAPFGLGMLVLVILSVATTRISTAQKPDELPEPEVVEFLTKDGVKLFATYYASDRERNAVPLILLHMYKGSRADFDELALYLQREHHHAVLALDLRGHGESTHQTMGNNERDLSPDRLGADDFARMASLDVEEAKRFLIREHNAGKVNIERLGVIGAEMGATVAVYWAYIDWTAPRLTIKQGQDVKALVLMSPETRFKSLSLSQPFGDPQLRSKVALHIIAGGDDAKAVRAAEQLYNSVRKYHKEPDETLPSDKYLAEKTIFLDADYDTSLQGTKMLGENLGVQERIARFIELRLVKPSYPWAERPSGVP